MKKILCLIISAVFLSISTPAGDGGEAGKKEPVLLRDQIVTRSHIMRIGDRKIDYLTRTGMLVLRGEGDRPDGEFFFIAYERKGISAPIRRPLFFSFNGGPGSSSVWLHLGLLGPKRVFMEEDGGMPSPPFRLVPNAYTLLDEADLVFIDPVSTGFSRAESPGKEKEFHGVEEDISSMGDFIRLYLSRYDRWNSPKFLIGESYGTTRAAGLSGYLQERHGIYLNGVVLVSSVLDHQTLRFHFGNDLPPALFLPSYTAAAWYHGKLHEKYREDLDAALKEAEAFVVEEYIPALFRGSRLAPEETERLALRLSELTGLPEDDIRRFNLRIPAWDFFGMLLKEQREKTGRLDSRFHRFNGGFHFGDGFFSDPSYTAIQGPYTAMLNHYVSAELGFRSDRVYEIITRRIREWKTGGYEGRYVNVADTLAQAMISNPFLKVFVASGYYDLATPYFATRYTFDHLFLPPDLEKNIEFRYYRAGHMMYIHLDSLKQLRLDLGEFLRASAGGK